MGEEITVVVACGLRSCLAESFQFFLFLSSPPLHMCVDV